jgi:hypothetical protein
MNRDLLLSTSPSASAVAEVISQGFSTDMRDARFAGMNGRAEVNLLWVISGFLLMLAVGFMAYDASSRVEESDGKLATLEQASADQLKQLEYYTALVHHAASVMPTTVWAGARRNPSANDIVTLIHELDRDTVEMQADSEPIKRLVTDMQKAATQLEQEYDREIKRSMPATDDADLEEDAPKSTAKKDEWLARDRMLDFAPLLAFNLPKSGLSEFDMLSKADQGALDATAKTTAQATPYANSYLTALVRAMAAEYKRLYDENQRMANDLFQPDAGRVAVLVGERETFEDSFRNSSSGITKATSDVINVDQGTAFQVSLDTIRAAQSKIDSALKQSIEGTSDVYREMSGSYLDAAKSLVESEAKQAKYSKRAQALEAKLASIIESDVVRQPAIDGRVIKVAPLRGSVFVDLNAFHHIDVGQRFEVFALSPEDRLRGRMNAERISLGAIQISEVGPKGATSRAAITRVVSDTREAWALWEGAFLVNRNYNPDYSPKIALLGAFRGFLTRETLADHLRAHNYVVQEAPDYETDFVIRGDGGIADEPTIDGLPMSTFGIRSVPMRRILRMLGLKIDG